MDKKNNMKHAMYEMFGVGAGPVGEIVPPSAKKEQAVKTAPKKAEAVVEPEVDPVVRREPQPKAPSSYLAPGTVIEGTLRAIGDVEIAGDFTGDITTEGTVILHSNIKGNLSVSSLDLSGCILTGDVAAKGMVTVSADSRVFGNVTAKELKCAGQITGDLTIGEHMALDATAQINGNITTGTVSVARGALIKGVMQTK